MLTPLSYIPGTLFLTDCLDDGVQDVEVKHALFSMTPWKAPGPDGYPVGFYRHNWDIIGNNLTTFVKHIWQNPVDIAPFNTTDICLIPKIDKPEYINQFRPISLCNVNYKLLTKIVVNRLKHILPDIISPHQTGFIPTRSIHENIIVAQEMVHSMNRMRGRTGFLTIKVDLMKAYDRLRWPFIQQTLVEIGLPSKLVDFIMHCVSTVKTNVLWNGEMSDFFSPDRGLRQGD